MTSSSDSHPTPTVATSTLMAYAAVVASIWAALFFPQARLWGISWYMHYPWTVRIGFLVMAALPPIFLPHLIGASRAAAASSQKYFLLLSMGTGLVTGLALVLLRARTFFLGDGIQVLAKLQTSGEHVKPWDIPIWSIQRALYYLLGGDGESAALAALQILSIGSGLIFLAGTCWAASKLFVSLRRQILFVFGMMSGGYSLLFFGYVENYPLFVAAVALTLLLGLLSGRALVSRYWPILPAALAIFLHPFGVFLLPAVIYILVQNSTFGHRVAGLSRGIKVMFALVLVSLGAIGMIYLWTTSYFFRFSLVPPVADMFTVEGYTLFSVSHLLDILNLVVMLSPGLAIVVVALFGLPVKALSKLPEDRFLLVASFSALALAFVVNPRLGMARDWDLFSFVGVPLVITGLYLLLDEKSKLPGGEIAAGFAIALSLMLLGPRVASQVEPETSISVFDTFANLDVIKSRNGRFLLQEYLERQGRMEERDRRARINGALLPHQSLSERGRILGDQGDWDEAVEKFKQALQFDPAHARSWADLGVVYHWKESFDSALICLKIADGLNPYSYSTYMKLAGTYYGRGDFDSAETYWYRAANVHPEDMEGRGYLLKLYYEQGRAASYDSLLALMTQRSDTPPWIFYEAARRAADDSTSAVAVRYFDEAIRRGLDSARERQMLDEYPVFREADE